MKRDPYCTKHGCPCNPECEKECYLEACGGDEDTPEPFDDQKLDSTHAGGWLGS